MSAADVVALDAPPPQHRIAYGEHPLQFGHLRLPEGAGPYPVVVFVHGGCWLSQYGIDFFGAVEEGLREAGYAVWSLEYRRVGDEGGGWPNTFLDVARGADHLRELAARFPLDLSRIVVSGHSAGGHLALWLAARGRITSGPLRAHSPLPMRAVLALAPAPDLEGLHSAGVCGEVVDRLMGGGPDEVAERYAVASPMQLVPLDVAQLLIIGSHDTSWAPSGRAYAEAARAAGADRLEVIEAPESGHFEMIAPPSSTWPLVLDALERAFSSPQR
jgi:acetyl esterase/lipase